MRERKNSIFGARLFLAALLLATSLSLLIGSFQVALAAKPSNPGKSPTAKVTLHDVNSGLTSPTGYRWLDVADQAYSSVYRNSYNYTQAKAQVTYYTSDSFLHGKLTASNLKPNFAYQLKLSGIPGTISNERIGLAGRWWQEEWNGMAWANGQNLNDKGDGSSPNPNDLVYFSRKTITDDSSPTGLHYRYTGYMLFGYFLTDSRGKANLSFQVDSSYHVLFKTTQRTPGGNDGPVKTISFDPSIGGAYDFDYGPSTVSIFGEWERLPMGGIFLSEGDYSCQIVLTEESFHGSGGTYAGNWAAAMGGNFAFSISKK